jgi:hypothetical protein
MLESEVEDCLERVRLLAEASGGRVDGIATPWPGHPAGSPPA